MSYALTVGLEVHAELKTKTKLFCACLNSPEERIPNKNICPICLAHPGTLPVMNKEAVGLVLKIGQAIGGKISDDFSEFDRKNYFYPDIPKGYQISQYAFPLVSGGELAGIKIHRIHLEEDTGKSVHDQNDGETMIDFNRAGVPLMELVTEPVIKTKDEAVLFAKKLKQLLEYLDASAASMEDGGMRFEANISISKDNSRGTKVEVKNLNSFKAVEQSIAYEYDRQQKVLEGGEKVVQETRGYDESTGETFSQRKKEVSEEYRYFPEPDLPKLKIKDIAKWQAEKIKEILPSLPAERQKKLIDLGVNQAAIEIFLERPELYDWLISLPQTDPKILQMAINYLLTDLMPIYLTESVLPEKEAYLEVMNLLEKKKISSRTAKDVLPILSKNKDEVLSNGSVLAYLTQKNILQSEDLAELKSITKKIIQKHPNLVTDYQKGKISVLQFLIGQSMAEAKGRGNPEKFRELLLENLKESETKNL